jgi:hypothetical protein
MPKPKLVPGRAFIVLSMEDFLRSSQTPATDVSEIELVSANKLSIDPLSGQMQRSQVYVQGKRTGKRG